MNKPRKRKYDKSKYLCKICGAKGVSETLFCEKCLSRGKRDKTFEKRIMAIVSINKEGRFPTISKSQDTIKSKEIKNGKRKM